MPDRTAERDDRSGRCRAKDVPSAAVGVGARGMYVRQPYADACAIARTSVDTDRATSRLIRCSLYGDCFDGVVAELHSESIRMSRGSNVRPQPRPPALKPRKRRGAHILSMLLFLAAIGFAIAAVFLYIQDRDKPEERVPPTAQPGQNQLATVLEAFKEGGLKADYGRTTGRSSQLNPPGQLLTVEGQSVYVYIYNEGDKAASVRDREAESATIDLNSMTIKTPSGKDLRSGEGLHVAQGSNVITVLVGGDDALAARIQKAVEALP